MDAMRESNLPFRTLDFSGPTSPASCILRCRESLGGKFASRSSGKSEVTRGTADGWFPKVIDLLLLERRARVKKSLSHLSPSPFKAAARSSFQTVSLAQPIKMGVFFK